jgi:S-DNA-T family DNA segregation ATPase FtsK/SpoIIIE
MGGADKLLGNGDLLYKPVGMKTPVRIQSGYASTKEIKDVVSFLKNEQTSEYSEEIIHEVEENMPKPKEDKTTVNEDIVLNPDDDLISQAVSIIVQTGNASTSFLQRKLKLGFARAARIMDEIEERGIVGPQDGAKPREVLITEQDWIEMQARR